MVSRKPILVTGSPRAGTSWTGRMLSQDPSVRYVHEPFNISRRPCSCGLRLPYWFYYLAPQTPASFHRHLKHTIFPSFSRFGLVNVLTEITQTRRIRPLSQYMQAYLPHRVLVKDPLALFSAETLAHRFDMDVIVLIRHPAAVVNSYRALNWSHPFSHFLSQVELMEDHLFPFRNEIEAFTKREYEIVDQISLLWKLTHHMILKFQKTHAHWAFIRYEDLVAKPIEGFRKIAEQIKLPFSARTQAAIRAHSLQLPPGETTTPYAIKQYAVQVSSQWKKSLTSDEILRIQRRVGAISSSFYSEQEWKL